MTHLYIIQKIRLCFYIDDTILIRRSKAQVTAAVNITREPLSKLGFKINEEKSVLTPNQELLFLWFDIFTLRVKVNVPLVKCTNLKTLKRETLGNRQLKVWKLAALTGKLVATNVGNKWARIK